MKRIRRCETCRHGIARQDRADVPFVECALIPPQPVASARQTDNGMIAVVDWVRPSMVLEGWCGQHLLSLRRLIFGNGPRA